MRSARVEPADGVGPRATPEIRRRIALLSAAILLACVRPPPFTPSPNDAPARGPGPTAVSQISLEAELRRLIAGFEGDVGIYVRHLGRGETVAIAAEDTFPTASMIKVPLLVALYGEAESRLVDLDARVPIPASAIQSDGDDLAARLRPDETVTLRKLAHLMVSRSDNTASVTIQELIGGAERVNEWLADNGFAVTRNNSRTPARREHHQRWGWGMTTPREIAELLVRIREGRAVSPVMDEAMYRLLTGSYWTGEALRVLPPRVQVASKQGAVSRSRSEVLLVHAPTGEYVLAVITKNQADTSWDEDNAGYELIRAVSAAVYRHYNPGDPWRPADRAASRGADISVCGRDQRMNLAEGRARVNRGTRTPSTAGAPEKGAILQPFRSAGIGCRTVRGAGSGILLMVLASCAAAGVHEGIPPENRGTFEAAIFRVLVEATQNDFPDALLLVDPRPLAIPDRRPPSSSDYYHGLELITSVGSLNSVAVSL